MNLGKFEKYQAQAPETIPLEPEYYRDNGETAVYWLSSAGVLINCHGINILIDPVLSIVSDNPAASEVSDKGDLLLLTAPPILPEQIGQLDAVLYTHTDSDHLGPITAKALANTSAEFHGTACTTRELERLGIGTERVVRHNTGETFCIGEMEITLTPAFHPHQLGILHFDSYFTPSDCCGFRIKTPEGVIWIPGDTILQYEHLQMKDIDLLFIDFGQDSWHFGLDGAIGLANVYENAELIMYHFGTFYAPETGCFNADPASAAGRLRHPERLHVLAPGEKLVLHPKRV